MLLRQGEWVPQGEKNSASPSFLLLYRVALLISLWALSPSWQLGLQSPFISTSIAATFAREPWLHCTFSGALWMTKLLFLVRAYMLTLQSDQTVQHLNNLLLPVWIRHYPPGQAVKNEIGVRAKLFGCVIPLIMPFTGKPGVHKQTLERVAVWHHRQLGGSSEAGRL